MPHRSAVLAALVTLACRGPQPSPPITAGDAPAEAGHDLVRTETGAVRGAIGATAIAWKGLPYAAPPVGDLRWRPPAAPAPWTGTREASGFGLACMQTPSSSEPEGTPLGSEDCLTLNVWRPLAPAAPRAVMVFVHGGYFTWGASSYRRNGVDLYDGTHLATAADVVVVTINYRVGALGFLAHPALGAGNYGLLDQIAALRWVQRNIAAFGGDPTRVTLFGQSAGAISTAALYASPLARGLFHRAILHSGNAEALPRDRAERGGVALAARLGCADAADVAGCLRGRTASAIVAALPESFATGGHKFGPIVDGTTLPDKPLELVEAGKHAPVPVLVATTATEFSTMVHNYLDGPLATDRDYAALLAKRFPHLAKALLAQYPSSAFASPLAAYTAVWSDAAFTCSSDWLATASSEHGPAYRFVFDHTYTGPLARFGAGHGLDLYLVFRNAPSYLPLTDEERALSDRMIAAWGAFARTGDPGWPRYTAGAREAMFLDDTLHVAPAPSGRCAFWRPILRGRKA